MSDKAINQIIPIIEKETVHKVLHYEYLKSGCYSDLFILNDVNNNKLLLKIYNDSGFAKKEYDDLSYLSQLNSKFVRPIYFCDDNKQRFMITKFIEGTTLNNVENLTVELRDNIIKTINELHTNTAEYFGSINSIKYRNWSEYFVNRSLPALEKSKILLENKYIDQDEYQLLIYTLKNVDLFINGEYTPTLIHGDLTPWNIIVNNAKTQIEGIIDPFNVCYGDKDYDLFLLEKGRGRELGLLNYFYNENDEKLEKKIALYTLWNEVKHYYFSKKKDEYSLKPYFNKIRKFI